MLSKQGPMWRSRAVGAAVGVLALCGSVQAETFWYVDDDAPADGDGLTWETGYQFLQDALAVAEAGDEIHVAQGTYYPDEDEENPEGSANREATFTLRNGVTMLGGFAGLEGEDPDERDPVLYVTILSGDLEGNDQPEFVNYEDNSFNVMTAIDVGNTTVLDGFTIRGGSADGPGVHGRGGGFRCESGSPLVRGCTVRENRAIGTDEEWTGVGGGIFFHLGSPSITECTLEANMAVAGPAANTGEGGGLLCLEGDAVIVDCTFRENIAIEEANITGTGRGGGLACSLVGQLIVTQCEFISNYAVGCCYGQGLGAGIYVEYCDVQINECSFTSNNAGAAGGGLLIYEGDSEVRDCVFTRNYAWGAGGAVWSGLYAPYERRLFINCDFIENETGLFDGMHGGGAVYSPGDSPEFWNCTFTGNRTAQNGGAIAGWGGELKVVGCDFDGNLADRDAGAIRWGAPDGDGHGFATIRSSILVGNEAGDRGGGLLNKLTTETSVVNCLFHQNVAALGGAICNSDGTTPRVVNCSITNNIAESGGAFFNEHGSHPTIVNSILWNDAAAEIVNSPDSGATVTFSDVQGGYDGVGNIDLDPMLDEDFCPLAGSPVIDAADNDAVPDGIEEDINWYPRFVDDPQTEDTGNGTGPIVDMGACEFQIGAFCPADFDDTREVGFADLLALLAAWGPCEGECPEDLDDSGDVGFSDLLALLAAWGPCSPVGACCFADGTCVQATWETCGQDGGFYQGENTDCDGQCPVGACCFVDGSCIELLEAACVVQRGFYQGDGTFCDEGCPLFPADDCADAPLLSDGTHSYSTYEATNSPPYHVPVECDEGGGTAIRADVWVEYSASCDGVATASTCDSTFDNRLAVYTADDCPGAFVACNDDACGTGGTRSEVSFPVTQGRRYLIRIGSRSIEEYGLGFLVIECSE